MLLSQCLAHVREAVSSPHRGLYQHSNQRARQPYSRAPSSATSSSHSEEGDRYWDCVGIVTSYPSVKHIFSKANWLQRKLFSELTDDRSLSFWYTAEISRRYLCHAMPRRVFMRAISGLGCLGCVL